jgi:hypothetical protein
MMTIKKISQNIRHQNNQWRYRHTHGKIIVNPCKIPGDKNQRYDRDEKERIFFIGRKNNQSIQSKFEYAKKKIAPQECSRRVHYKYEKSMIVISDIRVYQKVAAEKSTKGKRNGYILERKQ